MREIGTYFKSSFVDKRCCDDSQPQTDTENPTAWRPKMDGIVCMVDIQAHNTGYAHVQVLQEYYLNSGEATGKEKANLPSDPNYIPDYLDTVSCPLYVAPPDILVSLSKSQGGNQYGSYLNATITLPQAVSQTLTFKVQCGYQGSYQLPEEILTIPAGRTSGTTIAGGGGTDASYTVRINSVSPTTVDGKTIKFPNPV